MKVHWRQTCQAGHLNIKKHVLLQAWVALELNLRSGNKADNFWADTSWA